MGCRGFPSRWIARIALAGAGAGACAAGVGAQPSDWLNFAPAGATGASFWHPDASGKPIDRMLDGRRGTGGGPAAANLVVPPARTGAGKDGSATGDAPRDLTLSTALTDPVGSPPPFAAGDALPATTLLETTVAGARGGPFSPKAPAPQIGEAAPAILQVPTAGQPPAQGLSLRPSAHLEQARAKLAGKKRRAR